MPFFDEVKEIFEDTLDFDSIRSSCLVLGNNSVHIEGIKRISQIDEYEVCLSLKNTRLVITGEKLRVIRSQMDNVSVAGKIKSITFD